MVEDCSDESAFEATRGFWVGVAGVLSVAVVGLSVAVEADLGDRDAVQGDIELAVAATCHAHAAGGVGPTIPVPALRRCDGRRRLRSGSGVTPAVSPMSVAAVSSPQPGRLRPTG